MAKLEIECEVGEVSDGFHTFDELYDHRCTLFLALMKQCPKSSWISQKHSDGTMFDGWFIAGMSLASGQVTYHFPMRMWPLACKTGAQVFSIAPTWDGHKPADVVKRIQSWIEGPLCKKLASTT